MSADFYNSARWVKLAKRYRREHPECVICLRSGLHRPTRQVDHIWPIRDGGALYDLRNLQALCMSCHRLKDRRERYWREGKTGVWGAGPDGSGLDDPPGLREADVHGE